MENFNLIYQMNHSFETYLPWFILREIPQLGNIVYKALIKKFHTPENVFKSPRADLEQIERIKPETVNGILNHKKYKTSAIKELEMVLNLGAKIVTLIDPEYPLLLAAVNDPPPFLTYIGELDNVAPCLSIIGSRKATAYGLSTAENLSEKLSKKGFQIVSGMARGIDSKAHTGALKAKQKTIAVLGSGLNKIYPRENIKLFHEIAESGTVYSEFKINSEPIPSNFPVRNRIIAGLSCGTLVVEAAKKSGSLITARLAGEYNREVFAVPGSIASLKSQGTHSLLKQGAKLVENEMDIIDELGQFIHEPKQNSDIETSDTDNIFKKQSITSKEKQILNYIDPYPVHIDHLIKKSCMDSAEVLSQLLNLELSGQVVRHQGNYYSIPEEKH